MGKNLEKKKLLKKIEKANIILMMFAAIGAMLSLYLWKVHLTGEEVLCTTGGCDAVLKGQYSTIAEVPVAAYGVAFYAAVLILSFQRKYIKDQLLDKMLYLLVGSGVIFTLYLRYVEFAKIGSICQWCWGSVVVVVLMTTLLFFEWKFKKKL